MSFPGHPVTMEQVAGGGAPGKTDILGLKDFASGQPSPSGDPRDPLVSLKETCCWSGGGGWGAFDIIIALHPHTPGALSPVPTR